MFKLKNLLTEEEAALKEKYERARQRKAARAAGAAAPQAAEADAGAGGAAEEAAAAAAPVGRGGAAAPREEPAEAPPVVAAPAPVQRPVATREEVAKVLAAKRKGVVAAAPPAAAAAPVAAAAPEPAAKRAPRAPGEKRAPLKRPGARGEAEGAKRARTEDEAGKPQKANLWETMLAGGSLAAGLGTQRKAAAADVHTRRVFVQNLPATVDTLELKRVLTKYGSVEEALVDPYAHSAYVTFVDATSARTLVAKANDFTDQVGPPVLVNEAIVHVIWPPDAAVFDAPATGPEALAAEAVKAAALQGLSKQDQLNLAVKVAVQHFATAGAEPAAPASERPVLSYDDI